ncbi:MAG: trypco2 family protein [Methanotrichaceae archaeon]
MSLEGLSIADTIIKVKEAIKSAQTGNGYNFEIDKLELTLKAIAGEDAGGEFNVKIPFIDTKVGISGKYANKDAQIINITLIPEKKKEKREWNIKDNLVKAMAIINEGVGKAAQGEPQFGLKDASVELNFVVDKNGEVAFVVKGGLQSEITNTVKLYLKPKS